MKIHHGNHSFHQNTIVAIAIITAIICANQPTTVYWSQRQNKIDASFLSHAPGVNVAFYSW